MKNNDLPRIGIKPHKEYLFKEELTLSYDLVREELKAAKRAKADAVVDEDEILFEDEVLDSETGDARFLIDNLVLPRPGDPAYELVSYFGGFISVYNALDTRKRVLTAEQVERIKYEYEYRLNAMLALVSEPELEDFDCQQFLFRSPSMSMAKELQKELPSLAKTIIIDVAENAAWMNDSFVQVEESTGARLLITTPKLNKFKPANSQRHVF